MNRRSFFRALGLSPLLVPAAVVAAVQEANKDMAPEKSSWITLNRFAPQPNLSPKIYLPPESVGSITFGVGQDNQLWIKSSADNKWKRIATDEKILV